MKTFLITAAILGGFCAAVLQISPATAATQPYGGCDEAYAFARSAGADDCREQGWTIRPRLVVDPHGWVHYSVLPHCKNEDGSGQRSACTWNLGPGVDGNGTGRTFWLDRHDRIHYVKGWLHRVEGAGH
jgi:hypothetical protein